MISLFWSDSNFLSRAIFDRAENDHAFERIHKCLRNSVTGAEFSSYFVRVDASFANLISWDRIGQHMAKKNKDLPRWEFWSHGHIYHFFQIFCYISYCFKFFQLKNLLKFREIFLMRSMSLTGVRNSHDQARPHLQVEDRSKSKTCFYASRSVLTEYEVDQVGCCYLE